MFKQIHKDSLYYGFPVTLLATQSIDGTDNISPISSSWTLNNHVVLGVSLEGQAYQNMLTTKEATINIADSKIWSNIERIARTTGKSHIDRNKKMMGYQYCSDKFQLGGFSKIPSATVKTAAIRECPIRIEVIIENIAPQDDFAIIICKIKSIFVDTSILHDNNHIDVTKWNPLLYQFRSYTTTSASLGQNFRFEEYLDVTKPAN